MSGRLSLPHEHGGYLTALGAGIAAAGIAPAPAPALAVGVAVTAVFFARGAVDRLAAGSPLRVWDGPALGILGTVALVGALLAGTREPVFAGVTFALCAGTLLASAAARRARAHRAAVFEALAMSALGASAGLGALAAGTPLRIAGAAALVVAAHAAVAVPLVRTELRRRERGLEKKGLVLSAVVLLAVVGLLVLLLPSAVLALVPRAGHLAHRAVRGPRTGRPALVGLHETTLLAACVALLVLVARI